MARGNDIEGALRMGLVLGFDASATLREAWDDLAAVAPCANIFYEQWASTACAELPEAEGLLLLLAWADEPGTPRLVGLLPLQRRGILKGRVGVALQNWDQRVRALGEPLIRAGHEQAFWTAALDFLDRQKHLGPYLRLSGLIADSPSTLALRSVLAVRGRQAYVTRAFNRALLSAGMNSADYIAANVRKKVLKEQRRLRNRLEEQGDVVFDALPAAEPVDAWIDDLFRLEMNGWKGREGVAAAADLVTGACFRKLLVEAHARRRLDFRRLRVGGKVIALLANIEAGDTAFQLKIAYDEDYASFSPGVLIEMDYLEYALDVRKLARVDSCARPGHPMIDRIWVDRLPIVSLAIPFNRWRSRLICAAMDYARQRRERTRVLPTATDS